MLQKIKEERHILQTIRRRKLTGHMLRRKRLLKHIVEGKIEGTIEVTGKQGRRSKQLLDDLEKR